MWDKCISLLAVLLVSLSQPLGAQEAVYVIRHAEQDATTSDPALTEAGIARAERWDILADAAISVVFTSELLRSQQTGGLIAEVPEVDTIEIPRRALEELHDRIVAEYEGDVVLVVSHSGTIPSVICSFGMCNVPAVSKSDYGGLYIVTGVESGTPTLVHLNTP